MNILINTLKFLIFLVMLISCKNSENYIEFDYEKSLIKNLSLPDKTEIVNSLKRANDYWISMNDKDYDSDWNKSVYYAANLELYKLIRDTSYLKYSIKWAEHNKYSIVKSNIPEDVSLIINADKLCCGQAYFKVYEITGNDKVLADILKSVKSMIIDEKKDYWTWIDALFMAMPVFVEVGNYENNRQYYEKMYSLFCYTKYTLQLFDDNGLWYRDQDYKPDKNLTINGKRIQWSRGNAWVYAALAKTIDKLQDGAIGKEDYINTYKQMSEVLVSIQRRDGFWNRNLNDTLDYAGPETSGTALFTYGLAWGINNRILKEFKYWDSAIKGWNGLNSISLSETGFLGYIQPQASSPKFGGIDISENTEDFGVGAFLYAGCEIYKLKNEHEKFISSYY